MEVLVVDRNSTGIRTRFTRPVVPVRQRCHRKIASESPTQGAWGLLQVERISHRHVTCPPTGLGESSFRRSDQPARPWTIPTFPASPFAMIVLPRRRCGGIFLVIKVMRHGSVPGTAIENGPCRGCPVAVSSSARSESDDPASSIESLRLRQSLRGKDRWPPTCACPADFADPHARSAKCDGYVRSFFLESRR